MKYIIGRFEILKPFLVLLIFLGGVHTLYGYQSGSNLTYLSIHDLEPVFLDGIEKYSAWSVKKLQVTDIRMFPGKIGVPQGSAIDFEIAPPSNSKCLGRVSFLVTVVADNKPLRKIRLNGWVEAYKNVVCAARPLRKGRILGPDDVAIVKKPVSKMRSEPVYKLENAVGKALKRSVRTGEVITPVILQEPVLVKRGSRVTIVAESGGLFVRVPGVVKEKGSRGQFIKVQNTMSQREVLAQVVDGKTVKVFF